MTVSPVSRLIFGLAGVRSFLHCSYFDDDGSFFPGDFYNSLFFQYGPSNSHGEITPRRQSYSLVILGPANFQVQVIQDWGLPCKTKFCQQRETRVCDRIME